MLAGPDDQVGSKIVILVLSPKGDQMLTCFTGPPRFIYKVLIFKLKEVWIKERIKYSEVRVIVKDGASDTFMINSTESHSIATSIIAITRSL